MLKKFILFFVFLLLVADLFLVPHRTVFAQTTGAPDLTSEVKKIKADDATYLGALLFNAFGTGNNSIWASYALNDDQIRTLCGGPCGKIGVNAARFYPVGGGFYNRASGLGMQYTLAIATLADADKTIAEIKAANGAGITPVIRVGVQGDAYGFADPQAYINFLRAVNDSGAKAYAIAGPNEPDAESWASSGCTDIVCTGERLAIYMNSVINGAGGLSNITLLSPAFNMTNSASRDIVLAMKGSGANFNRVAAIAGNSYNIAGKGITTWVTEFMTNVGFTGKKVFLTEIGDSSGNIPGGTSPQPYNLSDVPCDSSEVLHDVSGAQPEYHSLRPYPASPCLKKAQDVTMMCANNLVVIKTAQPGAGGVCSAPSADGSYTCTYPAQRLSANVSVTLDKAKLPIMGNTEDVPNATWPSPNTNANNLTAAQRVNNYVSWYLNGVINRAESDFSSSDVNYLVNFSGPLNKLLPFDVQIIARLKSVADAAKTKDAPTGTIWNDPNARHNQVVGCLDPTRQNNWADSFPCYLFTVDRLINLFNGLTITPETIVGFERRLVDWKQFQPPIATDFSKIEDYVRALKTWQGNLCITFPIKILGREFYICPSVPSDNYPMAMLFPDIPYSSTEDRVGTAAVDGATRTGVDTVTTAQLDSKVSNVTFTPSATTNDQHNLYFAHMQEDAELAAMLQNTFRPRDESGNSNGAGTTPVTIGAGCDIQPQDTRTNPGDSLYGNIDRTDATQVKDQQISGTLSFDASYTCTFFPDGNGGMSSKCAAITATMGIYTQTPLARQNWNELVGGGMSIFKRIFPKVGADSVLSTIKEIPAVTSASYGSLDGSSVLAGNPATGKAGGDAQLYFPYIGGIQEYFLKGIQKALRPQGMDSEALAGQPSPGPNAQCSIDPTKATSVTVNGANYIITDGVIQLALKISKYTCTPAEFIVGVLAGETRGLNHKKPGELNFGVTDFPITGDVNESICRTDACLSNQTGDLGPFSWSQFLYLDQYKTWGALAKDCLAAVGQANSPPDSRIMGQDMCVTARKFWSSMHDNGNEVDSCSGSNQKPYTLDQVSAKGQELAFMHFCGSASVCSQLWDKVSQLINAYKDEVGKVRSQCSNP